MIMIQYLFHPFTFLNINDMWLKENFAIATLLVLTVLTVTEGRNEQFTESLTIRPLPDGKLLTHFEFTTRVPGGTEKGATCK
jgi:hypothetical protein